MLTKKIILKASITEPDLFKEIYSLKEMSGFEITNEKSNFYLRKNFFKKAGHSANLFNYTISSKQLRVKLQEIEIKIYPKMLVLLLFIALFLGCAIFIVSGKFLAGIINLLLLGYFYYILITSAYEEIEKTFVTKIK